jgi:hypothetical protein
MRAIRLISGVLSIAIAAGILAPQSAFAQNVGTLTAEKATISRGGSRIRVGAGISRGDQLASNASGSGMIVFEDQSSARMGPNARLTIDEFVYNPARRSGTIRLRQNGGVARIYGGQISKRGRSEVRTPHIVLAVRGGIVDSDVSRSQSVMTLRGGLMVCRVGNRKVTVTNPGFSCISDGSDLQVARVLGGVRKLVTPANPGQGGAGGNGRYDSANCASAAGAGSANCQSRDGGLPGPGKKTGNNQPGGMTPGGRKEDPVVQQCRDPQYCY